MIWAPKDVSSHSSNVNEIYEPTTGEAEIPKEINKETSELENDYHYGEHIACVWADDVGNDTNWHLGVVDKYENGELLVSYMKRTDKKGLNWLFPEEAEIHVTHIDQIIARNIPVKYSLTAMMRCILDSNIQRERYNSYQKLIG